MTNDKIKKLNFTRKHFIFLADTFAEIECDESRQSVTSDTIRRFENTHPGFNAELFKLRVEETHNDIWHNEPTNYRALAVSYTHLTLPTIYSV